MSHANQKERLPLSSESLICDVCRQVKILVSIRTTHGFLCIDCYKEYQKWVDDD